MCGHPSVCSHSCHAGAGKTTLLREALENKQGLKIAVVVNDVAKINIDSKLVRERTSGVGGAGDTDTADCVELQNGCACCNASDELLQSISQLLRLANRRGHLYDRVIIEMSGVAEPKNIRREFSEAAEAGHIALSVCELQTMITVVDSPSFSDLYSSRDTISDRPDLCAEDPAEEEQLDNERKVVDLLVEQIECADYLVLNKQDKCSVQQMETLTGIANTINPAATVLAAEWGKVPLDSVFGPPKSNSWVSKADDEDDLRDAVEAAKQLSKKRKTEEGENAGHGHEHQHGHEHGHGHAETAGHGTGHSHEGGVCSDPSAHEGGHGHGHGHGHDADKARQTSTTASVKYGITSFVYVRRRPFHPQRLMKVPAQPPGTRAHAMHECVNVHHGTGRRHVRIYGCMCVHRSSCSFPSRLIRTQAN